MAIVKSLSTSAHSSLFEHRDRFHSCAKVKSLAKVLATGVMEDSLTLYITAAV